MCPEGKFQPNQGQTECQYCAAGQYSASEGAAQRADLPGLQSVEGNPDALRQLRARAAGDRADAAQRRPVLLLRGVTHGYPPQARSSHYH